MERKAQFEKERFEKREENSRKAVETALKIKGILVSKKFIFKI